VLDVHSTDPERDGRTSTPAVLGLLLIPVLCCGVLPLLIVGGALAGLGSVLGNPWMIGAAVALVVGVVLWRVRRNNKQPPYRDRLG
jgi:hypothetical protein